MNNRRFTSTDLGFKKKSLGKGNHEWKWFIWFNCRDPLKGGWNGIIEKDNYLKIYGLLFIKCNKINIWNELRWILRVFGRIRVWERKEGWYVVEGRSMGVRYKWRNIWRKRGKRNGKRNSNYYGRKKEIGRMDGWIIRNESGNE